MKCEEKWLEERLMNLLRKRTRLPLAIVERMLSEESSRAGVNCEMESIRRTIQKALDSWRIDKAIDRLGSDAAHVLHEDSLTPVWHLKVLSQEKSQFYQNLEPVKQEVIRLLREANDSPETLGQIPRCVVVEILRERGYDIDPHGIWVEDTMKEYLRRYGGGQVWWWGLLSEREKTEEFKHEEEEVAHRRVEKDDFLSRLDDEEPEDEE